MTSLRSFFSEERPEGQSSVLKPPFVPAHGAWQNLAGSGRFSHTAINQRGKAATAGLTPSGAGFSRIVNDVVAEIDAFVTDEHMGTCHQLLDLVLALATERATERARVAGLYFFHA